MWMPTAIGIESSTSGIDEALLVGLAVECAIEDVRDDDEVHEEIEVEHDDVPGQDRAAGS